MVSLYAPRVVKPLRRRPLLTLALLAALVGCERSDAAGIPEGLSVQVIVDGEPGPLIDTARLRRHPPDFKAADRHGWRLSTLLPKRYRPADMTVEVEDPAGDRHLVASVVDAGDRIVVVAVNKSGLRVAQVSAEQPWPPFHGRGGNRGRQGDPSRIKRVKRVVLTAATASTANPSTTVTAAAAAPLAVEVRIQGGATRTWTRADLNRVPTRAFAPGDGDGERAAWSLRDVVATMVGKEATLLEVHGKRGRHMQVPAASWADPTRTPLLRINRDGELKFLWVGEDMRPLGDRQIRRVQALVIKPHNSD